MKSTNEDWKRKIGDHRKSIKAKQKQDFAKIYNKVKTEWKPKPLNKVNMQKHFRFMKLTTYIGNEDIMPSKAEFAIWPVLCSKADFRANEWFKLSEVEIAGMSGLSKPSVIKAVNRLCNRFYGYDWDHSGNILQKRNVNVLQKRKVIDGKRRYYEYKVHMPRFKVDSLEEDITLQIYGESDREYFVFHTCIIETGIWAKLSLRAKMLYLALRSYSYYDHELYLGFEEMDLEHINMEYKFLICDKPLTELCQLAMISTEKINKQVAELERVGLLANDGHYFIVGMYPTLNKIKLNDY